MKKIYLTPKQLIIDIDAREALLTGSLESELQDKTPSNENPENQFSRDNSTLWDNEW